MRTKRTITNGQQEARRWFSCEWKGIQKNKGESKEREGIREISGIKIHHVQDSNTINECNHYVS